MTLRSPPIAEDAPMIWGKRFSLRAGMIFICVPLFMVIISMIFFGSNVWTMTLLLSWPFYLFFPYQNSHEKLCQTSSSMASDGENRPSSSSSAWSTEEDQALIEAVDEMGSTKVWKTIVACFHNNIQSAGDHNHPSMRARTPKECIDRWNRVLKYRLSDQTPWTEEDDNNLLELVETYDSIHHEGVSTSNNNQSDKKTRSHRKWTWIARRLPNSVRYGPQCQKRWKHLMTMTSTTTSTTATPTTKNTSTTSPGRRSRSRLTQGGSRWTEEENQRLREACAQIGRRWTEISRVYLPERNANAIQQHWKVLCTQTATNDTTTTNDNTMANHHMDTNNSMSTTSEAIDPSTMTAASYHEEAAANSGFYSTTLYDDHPSFKSETISPHNADEDDNVDNDDDDEEEEEVRCPPAAETSVTTESSERWNQTAAATNADAIVCHSPPPTNDQKRRAWTTEEDEILLKAQAQLGNRWTVIVRNHLPERSYGSVQHRWKMLTEAASTESKTTTGKKTNPSNCPSHAVVSKDNEIRPQTDPPISSITNNSISKANAYDGDDHDVIDCNQNVLSNSNDSAQLASSSTPPSDVPTVAVATTTTCSSGDDAIHVKGAQPTPSLSGLSNKHIVDSSSSDRKRKHHGTKTPLARRKIMPRTSSSKTRHDFDKEMKTNP